MLTCSLLALLHRLSSIPMDDDLATGAGGIPSDDDEIEHQELDTAMQNGFRFRVRHLFLCFQKLILLTCLLVSRNS